MDMPKIVITRNPGPRPIVTGAAARAVEAADKAADTAYAALEACAAELSRCLCVDCREATAIDIANAVSALVAYNDSERSIQNLVPRHQTFSRPSWFPWPLYGQDASCSATDAVLSASQMLRTRLLRAGVPMADLPGDYNELIKYWQDAAARGC